MDSSDESEDDNKDPDWVHLEGGTSSANDDEEPEENHPHASRNRVK